MFSRTKLYAGSAKKKNPSINVRQPEVNGKAVYTFWRQRVMAEIINLLGVRRACRCNNHRCFDVVDNPPGLAGIRSIWTRFNHTDENYSNGRYIYIIILALNFFHLLKSNTGNEIYNTCYDG